MIPRSMWSADYLEYLRSPHWLTLRARIIKRAAGKCERCRAKSKRFQVHHKTYARVGEERDTDLEALCATCHMEHHGIIPSKPAKPKRNSPNRPPSLKGVSKEERRRRRMERRRLRKLAKAKGKKKTRPTVLAPKDPMYDRVAAIIEGRKHQPPKGRRYSPPGRRAF